MPITKQLVFHAPRRGILDGRAVVPARLAPDFRLAARLARF
jgi:hypothetical protein